MIFSNNEELRASGEYWKNKLNLQRWDIAFAIERASSLGDTQGKCQWKLGGLSALIQMLDPKDWENPYFKQDMEETLVHELLHLVFAQFDAKEGTDDDIWQEQAIETIARVLVETDRKARRLNDICPSNN